MQTPPYWNSILGFDFDPLVVIGMSFCICLLNFIVIGLLSTEQWRRPDSEVGGTKHFCHIFRPEDVLVAMILVLFAQIKISI